MVIANGFITPSIPDALIEVKQRLGRLSKILRELGCALLCVGKR